jgi:hypothetical protein
MSGDPLSAAPVTPVSRPRARGPALRVRGLPAVALLWVMQAQAGEVSHYLTPYLWGAGLSGVVGAGGVTADVDASFSDILSNLDVGFMANYRADWDDWLFVADAMYIDLGGEGSGPGELVEVRVDVEQTVAEFDVGRKVAPGVAVIAGVRYVDISSEARSAGPLGNTFVFRAGDDWVDPLVGVIGSTVFGEKASAALRADVGGFGVGADLTWQVVGSFSYQVTPSLALVAAYRHLDIDYDAGSGSNRFRFDAAMSGPALGVTFHWK